MYVCNENETMIKSPLVSGQCMFPPDPTMTVTQVLNKIHLQGAKWEGGGWTRWT
jgi:hypothetical protein